MPVEFPTIHLSPARMVSVVASLPPFLVGCHSLPLDQEITVGEAQNELVRSLVLTHFVNTLAALELPGNK